MIYIIGYIVIISVSAIVLTLKDKNAAQKKKWRIEERTLLIVSALGGSVAMLLTMRIVRHKTKHKKFMIGIPVMIILQVAIVVVVLWAWGIITLG